MLLPLAVAACSSGQAAAPARSVPAVAIPPEREPVISPPEPEPLEPLPPPPESDPKEPEVVEPAADDGWQHEELVPPEEIPSSPSAARGPVPGKVFPSAGVGHKTTQASPHAGQSARPSGSSVWDCAFPKEADAAGVDQASVVLRVTVSTTGKALRAVIVDDPGTGFGVAARDCALRHMYLPARDAQGKAIEADTPPLRVVFRR